MGDSCNGCMFCKVDWCLEITIKPQGWWTGSAGITVEQQQWGVNLQLGIHPFNETLQILSEKKAALSYRNCILT